jgi:hypothetical protein
VFWDEHLEKLHYIVKYSILWTGADKTDETAVACIRLLNNEHSEIMEVRQEDLP